MQFSAPARAECGGCAKNMSFRHSVFFVEAVEEPMAYPENTSPPNPYDLVGKPCVWTWNFAGSRGLQTVVLSFRRSNSFGAPSYACSLAIARSHTRPVARSA